MDTLKNINDISNMILALDSRAKALTQNGEFHETIIIMRNIQLLKQQLRSEIKSLENS